MKTFQQFTEMKSYYFPSNMKEPLFNENRSCCCIAPEILRGGILPPDLPTPFREQQRTGSLKGVEW